MGTRLRWSDNVASRTARFRLTLEPLDPFADRDPAFSPPPLPPQLIILIADSIGLRITIAED